MIRADRHLRTLLDFKYRKQYLGERAEHGRGSRQDGKWGKDIVLRVPCGTIVRDAESGEVLADLTDHEQEILVARGGRGGRGNAEFATSTNRAPRHAEPGTAGEERSLVLELKLLADVGLVGLPNSGKSTLISVISAAKPKIADYPFTTLQPNLGIVRLAQEKSFVVADIPGLIEGAHQGKGLGIQFLRHIERTKVLVFLVEAVSRDPKTDFRILFNELKAYDPALTRKPRIVAVTKIDLLSHDELRKLKNATFGRGVQSFFISSVANKGIEDLAKAMWKLIQKKR